MNSHELNKSNLIKYIISDSNIYSAIYSLESYIFEKNLLNKNDLELFYKLRDKYDDETIKIVIEDCKLLLKKVLLKNDKFDIEVYFKIKKYDDDKSKVEFRPRHTASLVTQISIVSILNIFMFSIKENEQRQLSDLSQLLPSNFYGNLPSDEYENIFYNWKDKYKDYTENIMKEYDLARRNNSYKYEVALDLKNFFPSVSPTFIYNFILNKIGSIYTGNDLAALQIALQKILYFKVTNLKEQDEIDEYYSNSTIKDGFTTPKQGDEILSIGLPQGLPQANYFGNIAMILVSKEFDNIFNGKSFYYVDDSVIYTNSINAESSRFSESLETLNFNINNAVKEFENVKIFDVSFIDYKILVHTKEKSSTAEVDNSIKMSKAFLSGFGREASMLSFEINNTTNEIQDISIKDKVVNIFNALEVEIRNVKEHIVFISKEEPINYKTDMFEIYLKSLIRYKKFFGYRKRILEIRNNYSDFYIIKGEFYKKYLNIELNSMDNIKQVFLNFDEEIFLPEALLIFYELSPDDRVEFVNKISEFERNIIQNNNLKSLYYNKIFDVSFNDSSDHFATLKRISSKVLGNFSRKTEENVISNLLLSNINEDNKWLGFNNRYIYNKVIFKYSQVYKRNILNSYISTVLNVDINNDIEFIKLDKRPLKYYELRVLLFIRNKNTTCEHFITFLDGITKYYSQKNYEKVDFSLIEVLDIFRTYVRDPQLIDELILVHKYISSIWRNGSRFLYFYTLHNQEHSVELIKSTVNITKMIDFIQIKNTDFYILFLSCYLHDVSMILQPSLDSFIESNYKTDELYTSFLKFKQELFADNKVNEFHYHNKYKVKNLMKFAFESVNYYFESLSRDTHVGRSSEFIKKSSDLNFINIPIRQIVSKVSEAHGSNTTDVYGLKSLARCDVLSEKYMMILLRIADLLDIAKDRVSLDILDRNIANMPGISKFHWITHSIIDKFELKSTYKFIDNTSNNSKPKDYSLDYDLSDGNTTNNNLTEFKSVLNRDNFEETILVVIYLNSSNLTRVDSLGCENVASYLNLNDNCIELTINQGETCKNNCNFLCKWICYKNSYLIPELNALQEYIKSISNLNFITKTKVILNFSNSKPLKNVYFDIVNETIK